MADIGRQQAATKSGEGWTRGPRSLFIKRCDHGFGFTLRHFIVYPPESYTLYPGDASGAPVAQAMDTIFVKHVHARGPAHQAGLATGDRIVSVDGANIAGHSYAQVVQLIQQSTAPFLHLVVVPKEHDILQLYFGETAHNPETNQRPSSRLKSPSEPGVMQKATAIPARVHHSNATQQKHKTAKHRQSLDNTGSSQPLRSHPSQDHPRQSLDNARQTSERSRQSLDNARQQSLDSPEWSQTAPIGSENVGTTARYRTPNRRASEGNNVKRDAIYGNNYYTDNELWNRLGATRDKDMVMSRGSHGRPHGPLLTPSGSDTSGSSSSLHGPGGSSGCDSRRESNTSLPSRDNLTDSKDSLSSFDSTSTLTGLDHSSDDSLIMSRIRKSFEQKEEFLRRPTTPILYPADPAGAPLPPIIAREFYARPQKMKPVWPPNASPHDRNSSPVRASPVAKPAHHNFRRVKSEIDTERDSLRDSLRAHDGEAGGDGVQFVYGGAVTNVPDQGGRANSRSQQRSFVTTLSRIHENRTADLANGDGETVSLPSSPIEDLYSRSSESSNDEVNRYTHHGPLIQLVSRRARQFESGHVADDQRTLLYKSELARLSSKRSVPNVAVRKREIEARSGTGGERRDNRDSQSMENTTTAEVYAEVYNGMSGNRTTMVGMKNIHCEPPTDFTRATDGGVSPSNDPVCRRARSNSAESWAAAFGSPRGPSGGSRNTLEWPPLHAAGGSDQADGSSRHKAVRQDSYLAAVRAPVHTESRSSRQLKRQGTSLDDCEEIPPTTPPARPTHLSLPAPNPCILVEDSAALTHTDTDALIKALDEAATEVPKLTTLDVNNGVTTAVVRRQKNQLHTPTDDDRLRRASYLKATNSDRMHVDSDHEYSDSDLQTRSANRKWRPPMFPDDIQQLREFFEGAAPPSAARRLVTSRQVESVLPVLEDNKENQDEVNAKEGWLHCKITVIDGKRASDRSWKQVWAVLCDHTLLLYKERPSAVQSQALGDATEPQTVDVACSQTEAAGGYTKKKHALRLNTLSCSELLLQADDAIDAQAWLAALQEQAAIKDDANLKAGAAGNGASRLSPQAGKGIRKLTSFRNRSPTGQSPVNKTLKPSQTEPLSSPKTKTWKGRVARQFRRIHGTGSPSSPTAPNPEGSTIGILLEDCPPSEVNEFVPFLVVKCASIVEERGLDIIGIYRVPGNTAAVSSLTEAVNKGFQFISYQDPRWTDVNVISSLLKLFFRRLPDALLTSELYPLFIDSDKMDDPNKRITTMRKLVHELPDHHFETLKFLCMHLKRVIEHSHVNKMEARNLAIVFGPTLIRTADNNMVTMVTDMSHQCRIVESLLLYTDWFFSDEDLDNAGSFPFPLQQDSASAELETSAINHNLLLSNIQKVEGMKSESSGKDILAKVIGSSIISAANRKMQKAKSRKGAAIAAAAAAGGEEAGDGDGKKRKELRDAPPTDAGSVATSAPPTSLVASSILESVMLSGNIVKSMQAEGEEPAAQPPPAEEQQVAAAAVESPTAFEDGLIRTYAGLSATTQERIRKFELETKAMLQRDLTRPRREPEDSPAQRQNVDGDGQQTRRDVDREDVHQSDIMTQQDVSTAYTTDSVSRTSYDRQTITSTTTSRFDQSPSRKQEEATDQPGVHRSSVTRLPGKVVTNIHLNPIERLDASRDGNALSDDVATRSSKKHQHNENSSSFESSREVLRRGSSAENISAVGEAATQAAGGSQAVINGALKRFKTGREQMAHPSLLVTSLQCSSLDSLQEALGADRPPSDLSDDGSDLLASLTSTFDRKLKSMLSSTPPTHEEPANEETPLLPRDEGAAEEGVEAVEGEGGKLSPTYRDPSLHRGNSAKKLATQDSLPAAKEDKELIRRRWLEEDDPTMALHVTEASSIDHPVEATTTLDDETNNAKPTLGFKETEARVGELSRTEENRLNVSNCNAVVVRREHTSNARRPESLKVGNKEYSKLKRSESLTKADKVEATAANTKLKRSESLTKAEDKQNAKLKRSDSLTKTEKTESNISKRRQLELVSSRRNEKENVASTKLKRKNGMPERSIKRRHTVGGTKDFDKVNWLDNRLQQEQLDEVAMNDWSVKERRCLRTSSPDLSSSRLNSLRGREGFLVEIRSRQQAAARPQSLADANIASRTFKSSLPLESHV